MKLMKQRKITILVGLFSIVMLLGVISIYTLEAMATHNICSESTEYYTAHPTPAGSIRFAVIGDFGRESAVEKQVAELVNSWNPDFIVTVGDNNYPVGSAKTIDDSIGQYYSSYIGNYQGKYGSGAETNKFYPTLGNHDWITDLASPYFAYFTLPGNERYYDVVQGPVHLFILSSNDTEPDGNTSDSIQAKWLQTQLETSVSPFNIAFTHHPPYSSGYHGPTETMRWPFAEWGIDAVFSGHEHSYERLQQDGVTYVVDGLAGSTPRGFRTIEDYSKVQYDCSSGAVLVEANEKQMTLQFITVDGLIVDKYTLSAKNGS